MTTFHLDKLLSALLLGASSCLFAVESRIVAVLTDESLNVRDLKIGPPAMAPHKSRYLSQTMTANAATNSARSH